jgi:hypothetical protein
MVRYPFLFTSKESNTASSCSGVRAISLRILCNHTNTWIRAPEDNGLQSWSEKGGIQDQFKIFLGPKHKDLWRPYLFVAVNRNCRERKTYELT